jgi:3-hydroxyacyl-[acyl-carrier-protein] dehydratase
MSDQPTNITRTISIDAGHPAFEGHFPGFSVYPGVAQIQDICTTLTEHFGRQTNLLRITRTKFLALITPPATIEIACRVTGNAVVWTISNAGEVVCKGSGHFEFTAKGDLVP